ncbi:helix-turn-helix domain-containing protein [Iocasia frigidifontis]|uniref:Helix-turn-helix domain-containing protein n=1 Tax=Iocasia fonsfrigidae TaxID=2682810 RepID=A0A8A7KJ73_9FIRM|nr:XRE family transcriptional regulator [Halocella sp. SP3-1]MTI59107.1 helix-turn-helix transcriptional regulator [Bacillota bacterium]QTL99888.1 helix-turn-helix domain-containing protein [Iocasia fonsfrigidae]
MNLAKLKKLRVEKGFTQQEMAEKLGYKGKSGYCQLENGTVKMTLEQAKKIAEILGDDIEKIFF